MMRVKPTVEASQKHPEATSEMQTSLKKARREENTTISPGGSLSKENDRENSDDETAEGLAGLLGAYDSDEDDDSTTPS